MILPTSLYDWLLLLSLSAFLMVLTVCGLLLLGSDDRGDR